MSRVIHFKSEDEVIWSVTHTEAAHYVILKGDKPYRYLREINHTDTHTEAMQLLCKNAKKGVHITNMYITY